MSEEAGVAGGGRKIGSKDDWSHAIQTYIISQRIVRTMKSSSVFVVIMAVVILMAALSGCTSSSSPPAVPVAATPAVTSTPAPATVVTTMQTTVPTAEPDMEAIVDKEFVDATEACYSATPVISSVSTQIAFVTCMQNTPLPKGLCAVNYRNNILNYMKDDDTTAGYSRMNTRIKLAREAYSKDLSYNYLTDKDEVCSPLRMSYPI
jgi:hypothetical protein